MRVNRLASRMSNVTQRGNLYCLLTDILRGPYCTFFVKAGGCVDASMKNFHLQKPGDLWLCDARCLLQKVECKSNTCSRCRIYAERVGFAYCRGPKYYSRSQMDMSQIYMLSNVCRRERFNNKLTKLCFKAWVCVFLCYPNSQKRQ